MASAQGKISIKGLRVSWPWTPSNQKISYRDGEALHWLSHHEQGVGQRSCWLTVQTWRSPLRRKYVN